MAEEPKGEPAKGAGHGRTRRALCRAAAAVLLAGLAGCEYELQPVKGREGQTQVFVAVGKDGGPNAGLLTTSLGAVVIDPGLSPDLGQALRADALRKSRAFWDTFRVGSPKRTLAPPVLYVFNTTYRGSHTFGNGAFVQTADIISSERAGRHLANFDDTKQMKQFLAAQFKVPGLEDLPTTAPTFTVKEGGELTLRSDEVETRFMALGDCVGEGDSVVYLPQHKVLFAGDLVLVGFVPYGLGRTPTVRNWIAVLKKLQGLDVDTVIPGHGLPGGRDLLAQQIEFLQALVDAVQKSIADGKTEEQAAQAVALERYAAWRFYKEWLPDNVRLVYRELKAPAAAAARSPLGPGATEAATGSPSPRDPYRDR